MQDLGLHIKQIIHSCMLPKAFVSATRIIVFSAAIKR